MTSPLPECTCGGRLTFQHLSKCPMGKELERRAKLLPIAQTSAEERAELLKTAQSTFSMPIPSDRLRALLDDLDNRDAEVARLRRALIMIKEFEGASTEAWVIAHLALLPAAEG